MIVFAMESAVVCKDPGYDGSIPLWANGLAVDGTCRGYAPDIDQVIAFLLGFVDCPLIYKSLRIWYRPIAY